MFRDRMTSDHAAVERWLHEAVVPVFDRVATGKEALIDLNEAFSGLETRYRARKSEKAGR